MRLSWPALTFLAVVVAVVSGEDELPLAEPCNAELCNLPDCRCSSTSIPGNLNARDTPQLVTLTFDDAVTITNMLTYRNLLYNRRNFNGCSIGTTFFVSHEWTNYQLVNELYNRGFEIALHSMSHVDNQPYWRDATYEVIAQEIGEQKEQMAHFANIAASEIKGVRAPFLQTSGNPGFQVIKDYDLLYDSSIPTITFRNPGLWPYSLDYASTQDCQIGPCPNTPIPGVWVSPLIAWTDVEGFPCSFVDACVFTPDRNDEEGWFKFIVENFERHYLGTRAPFGFYIHEGYLAAHPAVYRALDRFIELISNLSDVFMVNESEAVEWTQNPVPIDEYRAKGCRSFPARSCASPHSCTLTSEHSDSTYWMQVCTPCPRTYPWVGNPFGL